MIPVRVYVSHLASGRRVDNNANMRIQQAQADRRRHAEPGLRQFSEDRELLIRFTGQGKVAIASFYRYVTPGIPGRNRARRNERVGRTKRTDNRRDGETWI